MQIAETVRAARAAFAQGVPGWSGSTARQYARHCAWAVVAPFGRYCSGEDCERCADDEARIEQALDAEGV